MPVEDTQDDNTHNSDREDRGESHSPEAANDAAGEPKASNTEIREETRKLQEEHSAKHQLLRAALQQKAEAIGADRTKRQQEIQRLQDAELLAQLAAAVASDEHHYAHKLFAGISLSGKFLGQLENAELAKVVGDLLAQKELVEDIELFFYKALELAHRGGDTLQARMLKQRFVQLIVDKCGANQALQNKLFATIQTIGKDIDKLNQSAKSGIDIALLRLIIGKYGTKGAGELRYDDLQQFEQNVTTGQDLADELEKLLIIRPAWRAYNLTVIPAKRRTEREIAVLVKQGKLPEATPETPPPLEKERDSAETPPPVETPPPGGGGGENGNRKAGRIISELDEKLLAKLNAEKWLKATPAGLTRDIRRLEEELAPLIEEFLATEHGKETKRWLDALKDVLRRYEVADLDAVKNDALAGPVFDKLWELVEQEKRKVDARLQGITDYLFSRTLYRAGGEYRRAKLHYDLTGFWSAKELQKHVWQMLDKAGLLNKTAPVARKDSKGNVLRGSAGEILYQDVPITELLADEKLAQRFGENMLTALQTLLMAPAKGKEEEVARLIPELIKGLTETQAGGKDINREVLANAKETSRRFREYWMHPKDVESFDAAWKQGVEENKIEEYMQAWIENTLTEFVATTDIPLRAHPETQQRLNGIYFLIAEIDEAKTAGLLVAPDDLRRKLIGTITHVEATLNFGYFHIHGRGTTISDFLGLAANWKTSEVMPALFNFKYQDQDKEKSLVGEGFRFLEANAEEILQLHLGQEIEEQSLIIRFVRQLDPEVLISRTAVEEHLIAHFKEEQKQAVLKQVEREIKSWQRENRRQMPAAEKERRRREALTTRAAAISAAAERKLSASEIKDKLDEMYDKFAAAGIIAEDENKQFEFRLAEIGQDRPDFKQLLASQEGRESIKALYKLLGTDQELLKKRQKALFGYRNARALWHVHLRAAGLQKTGGLEEDAGGADFIRRIMFFLRWHERWESGDFPESRVKECYWDHFWEQKERLTALQKEFTGEWTEQLKKKYADIYEYCQVEGKSDPRSLTMNQWYFKRYPFAFDADTFSPDAPHFFASGWRVGEGKSNYSENAMYGMNASLARASNRLWDEEEIAGRKAREILTAANIHIPDDEEAKIGSNVSKFKEAVALHPQYAVRQMADWFIWKAPEANARTYAFLRTFADFAEKLPAGTTWRDYLRAEWSEEFTAQCKRYYQTANDSTSEEEYRSNPRQSRKESEAREQAKKSGVNHYNYQHYINELLDIKYNPDKSPEERNEAQEKLQRFIIQEDMPLAAMDKVKIEYMEWEEKVDDMIWRLYRDMHGAESLAMGPLTGMINNFGARFKIVVGNMEEINKIHGWEPYHGKKHSREKMRRVIEKVINMHKERRPHPLWMGGIAGTALGKALQKLPLSWALGIGAAQQWEEHNQSLNPFQRKFWRFNKQFTYIPLLGRWFGWQRGQMNLNQRSAESAWTANEIYPLLKLAEEERWIDKQAKNNLQREFAVSGARLAVEQGTRPLFLLSGAAGAIKSLREKLKQAYS